ETRGCLEMASPDLTVTIGFKSPLPDSIHRRHNPPRGGAESCATRDTQLSPSDASTCGRKMSCVPPGQGEWEGGPGGEGAGAFQPGAGRAYWRGTSTL